MISSTTLTEDDHHTFEWLPRSIRWIMRRLWWWNCRLCWLSVGSIGSNPVSRCRNFTRRGRRLTELSLECHHTVVSTEIAYGGVAHRQMVQSRYVFMALVTSHVLVRIGLQVHSIQREAVQRTEHLEFFVGVEPLDHVEIRFFRFAPGARNDALPLRLEVWQA